MSPLSYIALHADPIERQILEASVGLTSGILEWSPVIDGVEFTDTPRKLMAAGAHDAISLHVMQRLCIALKTMFAGKFHKVPVIIGANRDEGKCRRCRRAPFPNSSHMHAGTDFNNLPITLNDTAYAAFLQSE